MSFFFIKEEQKTAMENQQLSLFTTKLLVLFPVSHTRSIGY